MPGVHQGALRRPLVLQGMVKSEAAALPSGAVVPRATIMETKNVISIGSLPANVTKIVTQGAAGMRETQESFPEEGVYLDTEMDRLEKIHLLNALEKTGGNRTEASKLLNISLRSLRYRLQKHGIE